MSKLCCKGVKILLYLFRTINSFFFHCQSTLDQSLAACRMLSEHFKQPWLLLCSWATVYYLALFLLNAVIFLREQNRVNEDKAEKSTGAKISPCLQQKHVTSNHKGY